jgi:protein-L-isoaspartate(D-aspartate) O-methyltransferase
MALSKKDLIKNLIQEGYLKTPLIIEAFQNIDRKDFVPEKVKNDAYLDVALPIGFGQTISQPLTVAFMLELLQPQPGEKILDIGAGSGWVTALLAYIVSAHNTQINADQNALVIAIERLPDLKEMAEKNISKYNFIEKEVAKVVLGDGSKGFLVEAPFDKIIAGAAGKEIPTEWKEQLKIGGRIVAPVEHNMMVLDKIDKDKFKIKEFSGFSFVPLIKGNLLK